MLAVTGRVQHAAMMEVYTQKAGPPESIILRIEKPHGKTYEIVIAGRIES
jgi:hypothetical protein